MDLAIGIAEAGIGQRLADRPFQREAQLRPRRTIAAVQSSCEGALKSPPMKTGMPTAASGDSMVI